MAIRNIRNDGDDILRKVSKPVDRLTPSLNTLIDDMLETLDNADGAGLAAVQVGILRRIAIVKSPENDKTYVLINPEVLEKDGNQEKLEACLSIANLAGLVKRPTKIRIKAQNRHLQEFILEATDLFAIVVSHELDHLDGILFTDVATKIVENNSPEYRAILEKEDRQEKRAKRKRLRQARA